LARGNASRSGEVDPRICVVGAGPGGLAAAHFLKERGYRRVTVLEKLDRVGGMCCSITHGYRSFDLGANYLTTAYRETLKLARAVGARTYTEGRLRCFDPQTERFRPMREAVLEGTSFWVLAFQAAKFLWLRFRLRGALSRQRPGFGAISRHPELTRPFAEWLREHGLQGLERALTIPITLFSYGRLDQVQAAYGLTYMSLGSFFDLAWIVTGLPRWWPKRLVDGFQRLWERVAWGLDVRLGARILRIRRGETIRVEFETEEQVLDGQRTVRQELEFDRLILACPLTPDVLEPLLGGGITAEEKRLSERVVLNPCVIATFETDTLDQTSAISYVLPAPADGVPSVVARQYVDNDLVIFFTPYTTPELTKDRILAEMRGMARKMGGELPDDYVTYDEWPYFPHVSREDMKAGYYTDFEAMQGENHTYYTNGLLSFELVESVVNYSKHLVANHFPRRTPRYARLVAWLLAGLTIGVGAWLLWQFGG
jgi:hypothetical protein